MNGAPEDLLVFPVPPLDVNCAILHCPKTLEAAVVDPGAEVDGIIGLAVERDLRIRWLWLTHGHFDHCLYIKDLLDLLRQHGHPTEVAIHKADANLLFSLRQQCLYFGFPPPSHILDKEDIHSLEDEQTLPLGERRFTVLHTPGHTEGSVCFLDGSSNLLLTGDTLFQGSIGRTDLPGGNYEILLHSIHSRILALPDHTRIVPGHGEATTVGDEKAHNPFLTRRRTFT